MRIGDTKSNSLDLTLAKPENNKVAFIKLLDALKSISSDLHPDLIVFDPAIADEFGIIDKQYDIDSQYAKSDGILQKNYPELRKINFAANSSHNNHIHISFSPQRAGTYIDYITPSSTDTWGGTTAGIAGFEQSELDELFTPMQGKILKNENSLFKALVNYGKFTPEAAAIFMMIMQRESKSNSFNGNINTRRLFCWLLAN